MLSFRGGECTGFGGFGFREVRVFNISGEGFGRLGVRLQGIELRVLGTRLLLICKNGIPEHSQPALSHVSCSLNSLKGGI